VSSKSSASQSAARFMTSNVITPKPGAWPPNRKRATRRAARGEGSRSVGRRQIEMGPVVPTDVAALVVGSRTSN
jgi:hypothetical protein